MFPPENTHILIVEDDPGTATLQRRTVERAGYQAAVAATIEEAVDILRAGPVHLVLLDNRLQGGSSGLDFLASLKVLAPDVPVIMVTGSELEGTVMRALRGGARDLIRKDRNYLEHLPRAISSVLENARLDAQLAGEVASAHYGVIVLGSTEICEPERRQLERAGFQVSAASNPGQLLHILGEREIGLLLIDIDSEPSGGLDAYRRIKAAGHDLPAILIGNNADESMLIEAIREGLLDFILRTGDYVTALQKAVHRVSERLRLQARLAESKARLAGIVNSAMDAILLLDEQSKITLFNPAAEALFQVPARDAAGHHITRYIPEIAAHLSRPGGVDDVPNHLEAQGLKADGKTVELELSVSRMDTHGRTFISVMARDVSERKELERALLQKDKLESLGVLAGGIAHDFNNLLVGILGNASLALETISTNNPARPMLKDVMLASETAANLTRQLLAYAGKGRFVTEPVDLSDLVRQISTLLQTSIPKHVQLRLELMDSIPTLDADLSQMQQIVMNLVLNAAEAIGDKPGTILITTGVQHVDENYIDSIVLPEQFGPGDYVSLQVHDSGAGMPQEVVDRIFDPFFTTKSTGRGLGLAAVLGIVRGHKGAIKVYSTPGQGTTFKLLFPAGEEHVPRPVPQGMAHRGAEGEMVLVVDDEQIVRRSAKAMLERYGYSVVLAENGKEALDLFRILADKIDVVLLDMTMPLMGGEETFRQIKAIRPEAKVILSSGYNEAEAVRRFAGKGLAGFLQKPYSAVTLAEKVRSVLGETRGTAQS